MRPDQTRLAGGGDRYKPRVRQEQTRLEVAKTDEVKTPPEGKPERPPTFDLVL